MVSAEEPVVVTISHRLGRDEAKRRIERSLAAVQREAAQFVKSLDYAWTDFRLDFRAIALWQPITGRIDIYDESVRLELVLPRLLHLFAKTIAGRIERRGVALLERPKN